MYSISLQQRSFTFIGGTNPLRLNVQSHPDTADELDRERVYEEEKGEDWLTSYILSSGKERKTGLDEIEECAHTIHLSAATK